MMSYKEEVLRLSKLFDKMELRRLPKMKIVTLML